MSGRAGMSGENASWIALDWGSTNLRAWVMDAGNAVVARAKSGAGTGVMASGGFQHALLELVEPWLKHDRTIPLVACGMVGARHGWVEAPYRTVPCAPLDGMATRAPATDPRLAVNILSGLCQPLPADVMRGEETQIAGWLASQPDFDGVVCLPGTHSKWVRVVGGTVESFATHMTGEMFALLSRQSVLRQSADTDDEWDVSAFDQGVEAALSAPAGWAAQLFRIRAESLLCGVPASVARARLSGLLIGAEVAATRDLWSRYQVAIVGQGHLAAAYARALENLTSNIISCDAETITLAGLVAAKQRLNVA